MKKMKYGFLFAIVFVIFTGTQGFSQKKHGHYNIRNYFGLHGGITKFDIATDNFETKQGNGFYGGLINYIDLPLKFYNLSFGLLFAQNNAGILGRPSLISSEQEFIDYTIRSVQLAVLFHVKVISDYVMLELGPTVQYSGEMEFDDERQRTYYINNYANLSAEDILKISPLGVNGVVGLSFGLKRFRLRGQYTYGFSNIFNKLNGENLNTSGGNNDFKGNQEQFSFGVVINL